MSSVLVGEFDGVFLMEAPDNASAAALAMAVVPHD
jgi:uncharacterized protein with GYD domain